MHVAEGVTDTGPLACAGSLALAWLEADLRPRLIVDESLQLLWRNRAAEAALQGTALEFRDEKLAAVDPVTQRTLEKFVEECTKDHCSICFRSSAEDDQMVLLGREVRKSKDNRYLALSLLRSGSGFRANYANLDKVFGLTPSEHKVLMELLNGNTADELADRLNISVGTARTHIRQIYSKLNVTSREGLFSIIRPYQI